jgi:hypothetical protein
MELDKKINLLSLSPLLLVAVIFMFLAICATPTKEVKLPYKEYPARADTNIVYTITTNMERNR